LQESQKELQEIKTVQAELIEKLEMRIKKHQDELEDRLD
jgi:hypothetical protein